MSERRVPEVVAERDRLGELLVEAQRDGDRPRDLAHLQRMGQPGAVVVPLRGEEYLRLMHQPAERLAVKDPITVARVGRAQRAVLDRAFASERVLGEAGVF